MGSESLAGGRQRRPSAAHAVGGSWSLSVRKGSVPVPGRFNLKGKAATMYSKTTSGFEVTAEPFYLEERSDPAENHYVWGYRITIVNRSAIKARLVSRYWRIIDANGRVSEVEGHGVVGEQPELAPGDSFQYSSGCPLSTSSGIMEGHYIMVGADGSRFVIDIPPFSLDLPQDLRTLN